MDVGLHYSVHQSRWLTLAIFIYSLADELPTQYSTECWELDILARCLISINIRHLVILKLFTYLFFPKEYVTYVPGQPELKQNSLLQYSLLRLLTCSAKH